MNKLHRVITFSAWLLSAGIPAAALAAPEAPALQQATEIRSAAASTAADYYGTYYLWWEDGIYAGPRTEGRIELRADGGTFHSNNYSAPFSWTVDENGLFTLNFNNYVEATTFRFISGIGTVETHHILTQITLQRSFTEDDDSRQLNVVLKRFGFYRFLTGGKPDEPYPTGTGAPVQAIRQAGLLDPTQFIQSNTVAAVPAEDIGTLTYSAEVGKAANNYRRSSHQLRFGQVTGTEGVASYEKVVMQQDGSFTLNSQPVSWKINANRTVTILEPNGDQQELAFLAISQAGIPVMQLRNTPFNQANSTIPIQPYYIRKQLQLDASQLAATPILELFQANNSTSRFWFELQQNGHGLEVSAADNNNDQQFSDAEILQTPIRWQLQNGVLEVRRYRYRSGTGKTGNCVPTQFAPATTAECITQYIRSWDILTITDHNGASTAAMFNVQRIIDMNRKDSWPATDILQSVAAIDTRFHQLKAERPIPIKPLVAGVAIADDVLRQCLLDRNPALVTDITELFCGGDIRNLQGIEQFVNLTSLQLYGFNRLSISGLALLKNLPNLRDLGFYNVLIGDTEFANLQGLDLNKNNDPRPSQLLLQGIGISDESFATLDSMNFKFLDLHGPLAQMPISRLPNDQTLQNVNYLSLGNLRLPNLKSELNRLSQLPNITMLYLNDLALGGLSGIELPVNLYQLLYAKDSFANITAAQLRPATLGSLSLMDATVPAIDFVTGLPQLKHMTLRNVTLQNWSPLAQPLPLKNLYAHGNLQVPCSMFQAISSANPTLVLHYDACGSSEKHSYELKLPNGVSALGVSFADPAHSAKGTLSFSDGKLKFVPAKDVSGWVEFYVTVQLSNGGTKTILFRTFVQKANAAQKGLPWWILTAPTT